MISIKRISSKFDIRRYSACVFVTACAFVMSLSCSNTPFTVGRMGPDSAVFNYVARVILHGGMPYRDTFDHKGPLIYLIDALGQVINKDVGVWIVEFAFITVALFFAYKIAELIGCDYIKSLLVVVISMLSYSCYLEGGNLTEEYACTFIMVSLYIFLKYLYEGNVHPAEIIICGASFATVCLLRINMVVLWGVMSVGVMIECIRKKAKSMLIYYMLLFGLGLVLVFVPVLIWLICNDSFIPFVEDYLLFNFQYASGTKGITRSVILANAIYYAKGVPVLLGFPILVFFCLKNRSIIDWLCALTAVLSIASMCMSGYAFGHYGMILIPVVSYAFARFFYEISCKKNNLTILIATTGAILFLFSANLKQLAYRTINLLFYRPSVSMDEATQVAEVIKNYTDAEGKITVCGNRDIIYLLSERMSSSIYSYQDPIAGIDESIREEYMENLQLLDTKMIVVNETSGWREELDEIINKNYELVNKIGTTEIYLLCDAKK